jgi:hypothetical protein
VFRERFSHGVIDFRLLPDLAKEFRGRRRFFRAGRSDKSFLGPGKRLSRKPASGDRNARGLCRPREPWGVPFAAKTNIFQMIRNIEEFNHGENAEGFVYRFRQPFRSVVVHGAIRSIMVTNQKTGMVLGYFVSAAEFDEYLKVRDLLPKAGFAWEMPVDLAAELEKSLARRRPELDALMEE